MKPTITTVNSGVQTRRVMPVTISASAHAPEIRGDIDDIGDEQEAGGPDTHRGIRWRILAASPRPVTMPSRPHIIWTAIIRGSESSAVQRGP